MQTSLIISKKGILCLTKNISTGEMLYLNVTLNLKIQTLTNAQPYHQFIQSLHNEISGGARSRHHNDIHSFILKPSGSNNLETYVLQFIAILKKNSLKNVLIWRSIIVLESTPHVFSGSLKRKDNLLLWLRKPSYPLVEICV